MVPMPVDLALAPVPQSELGDVSERWVVWMVVWTIDRPLPQLRKRPSRSTASALVAHGDRIVSDTKDQKR